MFLSSCSTTPSSKLRNLQLENDLFLAQFDIKTDVDDLHSVAGVATMLNDPRFSDVHYHAVAGAYGTQEGLYVPANELFETAFGSNWSDAHTNYDHALKEVTLLVTNTLEKGGNIWIADAGQSDFSADLVKNIKDTAGNNYENAKTLSDWCIQRRKHHKFYCWSSPLTWVNTLR